MILVLYGAGLRDEIDVRCSRTANLPYLFHFVSIFIPCLEPIFTHAVVFLCHEVTTGLLSFLHVMLFM